MNSVYLLLSIIISVVLGYVLLMMGPLVGGLIAFGIIAGCLFRGLYLLHDIHKMISIKSSKKDKVQEVYENYLKQKDIT